MPPVPLLQRNSPVFLSKQKTRYWLRAWSPQPKATPPRNRLSSSMAGVGVRPPKVEIMPNSSDMLRRQTSLPVSASRATGFWLLATPVDRGALLRPADRLVIVVAAAVLAFWPRENGQTGFRSAALILLVALYAVPAVVLDFQGEFLRGALLAVLVLAFLRLERLPVGDVPAAGVAAGVAAVLALLGGLVQINPIWLWDPYNPAQVSAGSQPDWYIGFLDGSTRLMPGWDINLPGN